MEKTKAMGLIAKAGRYGGTYAHKDIALAFVIVDAEENIFFIDKCLVGKDNHRIFASTESTTLPALHSVPGWNFYFIQVWIIQNSL